MSSPQLFQASSPLCVGTSRRNKSRFTYRNLAQLAQSNVGCPLRVIAHVDLDAFYAQCEMVRLNVSDTKPLAVQQWYFFPLKSRHRTYRFRQGLIAVNYPARKYGLTRHISITDAKKLCPDLILQHVPTWKEGDEKWAYNTDAFKNIATHKVSLDPYRLESRRILACIKENLPAKLQRVEKASVDEFFLDLSAQVHLTLLERYPELAELPPYDDPLESLPLPPSTVLDWQADSLVDLGDGGVENEKSDWDDISILIGSEIIRNLRAKILEKLKYTCSAGVAQNKMLAKLGSAYKKPNQQTVIRNRAIQHFLSDFKFTKIRGLGGKLGEQITSEFNTYTIKDLLLVHPDQLKTKLGDEMGTWAYQVIRGVDHSEVHSRTQIKSMLSAKSFQSSINTLEQANRWLRIFSADIFSRLIEEGVLENKRRPKTMNLHYRHGTQNKSKSCMIPLGKKIDELVLFEIAKNLMFQITIDGQVWPCTNLSLSVGGFEERVTGNMNIGAFLVKGEDTKPLNTRDSNSECDEHDNSYKKKCLETSAGIHHYFHRRGISGEKGENVTSSGLTTQPNLDENCDQAKHSDLPTDLSRLKAEVTDTIPQLDSGDQLDHSELICYRCRELLSSADALQSHQDWHLARDLQDAEMVKTQSIKPSQLTMGKNAVSNSKRKKTISENEGKKQSKLKFG